MTAVLQQIEKYKNNEEVEPWFQNLVGNLGDGQTVDDIAAWYGLSQDKATQNKQVPAPKKAAKYKIR